MRYRTALAVAALLLAAGASSRAATVDVVRDKWGVPHIFVPPSLGGKPTRLRALRKAIVALTTQYGTTDPTQWLTPKVTVEFEETSAAAILYMEKTIIERENRGTMNELIELLPTVASQIIVPPGNSGHIPPSISPEPPHLRDQVAPYESFQYHPLPFAPAELEGPTTTQTITVP